MPFDDAPPPPASQAPRTWHATLIEATRSGVRPEQGVFTQAMPPLAASARALGILRRAKAFLLAHPVRL
ncbi:hypothetical protein CK625_00165 [Vandammella animalimorsus]|uniref:Uncharacterized protein n=1 Tax=Vandammella animalimorsus TaxID=2029117 RepID=A0A2A2AK47_9BURK|nr:hypothetical protein CK625_00165 [Vandammella animalimorsus]